MARDEACAFVAQMAPIAALVPGDWVQLAIAEAGSDRLIGDVGVYLETDGSAAAIGFTLGREAQGRGHATRAVRSALALVFASAAIERVRAVVDARNLRSIRVLERAGFAREAERQVFFKGEYCTEFVHVCRRGAD
jgi:RimJ/RimL family protein N-acetyltransferase